MKYLVVEAKVAKLLKKFEKILKWLKSLALLEKTANAEKFGLRALNI